jgi:hypothetical protein
MLSLQKAGFDVIVWSLEPLDLPTGIENRDATEVVPRSILKTHSYEHWSIKDYPKDKAAAVFYSDVFRMFVLQQHGGWWFDLDVFCLKPVGWFNETYSRLKVVAGVEMVPHLLNTAVLALPNQELANKLRNLIEQMLLTKKVFQWGEIGPHLITSFMQNEGIYGDALHWTTFYAANFRFEGLWEDDPVKVALSETVCRTSAVVHWYNNIMHKMADGGEGILPKSYMGKLFATLPQEELLKYPVSSTSKKK